jgi:excisionase family DNA binding protein
MVALCDATENGFSTIMNADAKLYLNIDEFAARTGYSKSTIHRLKNAKKIPFYQPGGKGARLLFPPDAIEYATQPPVGESNDQRDAIPKPHLAGRKPAWMQ